MTLKRRLLKGFGLVLGIPMFLFGVVGINYAMTTNDIHKSAMSYFWGIMFVGVGCLIIYILFALAERVKEKEKYTHWEAL